MKTGKAVFAAGCFWGVQHLFGQAEGVVSTRAGYAGGHMEKPAYKAVCSGKTGHAEAVEVTFDPARTSYEKLVRLFFEIHDFTQTDGQGPDIGEQYRSEIFCLDKGQKKIAEKIIAELKRKGYKVATKVTKAGPFWEAEEYHQHYYRKKNGTPYCHFGRRVFS